mmetsp:Transcript_24681/g.74081  ORF Transcript_24681/g.74081 Transcript_24681/m.74081 type:complete len:589 (-) Transcript_24681:22-1788(-)
MKLWWLLAVAAAALQPPPQRHVVIAAPTASDTLTTGRFAVNNLLEGRVDVLCRCATAALWYSNGIRDDTTLWLSLGATSVRIVGRDVRNLNPDEKTFALQLRAALLADQPDEPRRPYDGPKSERNARLALERRRAEREPLPPGFEVVRDESLEALVARVGGSPIVLDEAGEPFDAKRHCPRGFVAVVGDHLGLDEAAVDRLCARPGATRVSLGARPLLASQCITLLHHGADGLADDAAAARRRTRRFKAEARQNRISAVDGEELARQLSGPDPYDEASFSPAHAAFKRRHNEVFAAFAERYCVGGARAFALDGPRARTCEALRGVADVVVANPFPDTCAALRGAASEVHEARVEAFLPAAAEPFGAVYLDGCGGRPEPLIACAAYLDAADALPDALALGFTLTSAEPDGRPLADREEAVVRAWKSAARAFLVLKQFADAEEALQEANVLDPTDAACWGYLALANLGQYELGHAERIDQAAKCLECAIQLRIADGPVMTDIGVELAKVDRLSLAADVLQRAAELKPGPHTAHAKLALARTYVKQNAHVEAADIYAELLETAEGDEAALLEKELAPIISILGRNIEGVDF